jgi:hypothetical protein
MTLQYLFSSAMKQHFFSVARECLSRLQSMAAIATVNKILLDADVVAREAQLLTAQGLSLLPPSLTFADNDFELGDYIHADERLVQGIETLKKKSHDLYAVPLILLRSEAYYYSKNNMARALSIAQECLGEAERFNLDPLRAYSVVLIARIRLALGHDPNDVIFLLCLSRFC